MAEGSARDELATPRVVEVEGRVADAQARRALDASFDLRRAVFVDEQGIAAALEWDGHDATSRHFVALAPVPLSSEAPGGTARAYAIGTARMRRIAGQARAERVAVRRAARRLGVGRLLMRALEARARLEGLEAVILHAQVEAVPFYTSLGYAVRGEPFVEAGIDHRDMVLRLA
ncbi:MAG: GNAT family N-acetyltransferase [Myxococcota bacterium]